LVEVLVEIKKGNGKGKVSCSINVLLLTDIDFQFAGNGAILFEEKIKSGLVCKNSTIR